MNECETESDSSQNTMKLSGTDYNSLRADVSGYTFSMPKKSKWTVELLGNTYFTPDEGKEPNWFHRKMQELAFGFKWKKSK